MAIDVTVEPATFHLVDYDAATIAELVAEAAGWFGLDGPITVRVDEGSPLGDVVLESEDPVVLAVEGGAFEDLRVIRKLSPVLVQTVIVRTLGRIADRRRPDFGAPPDAEISIDQQDAWDAWLLGRAARRGLAVPQGRWRYRFRNRHGFTDAADGVFDRLWEADQLTWADLTRFCEETAAARA